MIKLRLFLAILLLGIGLPACEQSSAGAQNSTGQPQALAVETFLQDISQNVAGERLKIDSLIPTGVDPHTFEPAPQDIAKITNSAVLIENGAGLESNLNRVLENAGGNRLVIDASRGLTSRTPSSQEENPPEAGQDPHFWLDPNNVVQYVKNIRDGLSQADPQGADIYSRNANAYIQQLNELDQWIRIQVEQIPPERRLLVTNHEEFGYFADRYGFQVVGAVIPSFTSDASPSAQSVARLVDVIRKTGASAVFLESGGNSQLVDQIAQETGARVAPPLYTHSLTGPDGPAPTYIQMMKYDVNVIVQALK